MIKIWISKPLFAYDLQALTKAFFSERQVLASEDTSFLENKDEARIEVHYTYENDGLSIRIVLFDPEEKQSRSGFVKDQDTELTTRGARRNVLKRMLYSILSNYLNIELPWGTLTGIRPTKIPIETLMRDKAVTEDIENDLLNHLQNMYLMSEEKAKLSLEISKRELAILKSAHLRDGYSVYIGIPFCPTTCLYCSFTSYSLRRYQDKVDEYFRALEQELVAVIELQPGKILDSVYIGGGTPTTLTASQLDWLLARTREELDFSNVKEFTVEAGRADSITREKLEVIKKHGVTRISINPQTMNQKTLDLIGRKHSVEQVVTAFELARELGFDNINMDLILGLPGETKEDLSYTLEEVKKLDPDSLTIHSLAIKRASRLREVLEEKGIDPMVNTNATMKLAEKAARNMGLVPYYLYRQKNMAGNFENVGYAKESKFGIYNILIMEELQSIVAIGAGTVSKAVYNEHDIKRCDCVKDVDLYIKRIDEMIERKRKLFLREDQ
jgi:oxygen-independent coproporphyrinogen-3 oxidase